MLNLQFEQIILVSETPKNKSDINDLNTFLKLQRNFCKRFNLLKISGSLSKVNNLEYLLLILLFSIWIVLIINSIKSSGSISPGSIKQVLLKVKNY